MTGMHRRRGGWAAWRRVAARVGIAAALLLGGDRMAGAQTSAPAGPKPGIRYVYLVRHGRYDEDASVDEIVGNRLNALGHEQARLVGLRLAGLPWRPEHFVCSNFARARETAADIGQILHRDAEVDTLLHECTPTAERADFMSNHSPADIAGCESNLNAAWAKYVRPSPEGDRCDLLVCHGNVIRWFVVHALEVDTRKWSRMPIGNGSLTVIAVTPDGATRLVMFSDVGHLPLDKQSWSKPGARWAGVEEK